MDVADYTSLDPVNVTSLKTAFPKFLSEREYIIAGAITSAAGSDVATIGMTRLGPTPNTGLNTVKGAAGGEVLGIVSLLNAGGGSVTVCNNGTLKIRSNAGVESSVAFAANSTEPALTTVLGVTGTDAWTLVITRSSADAATFVLTNTTTSEIWNAATGTVTGIMGTTTNVIFGRPVAGGTPHSAVKGGVQDVSFTAFTLS